MTNSKGARTREALLHLLEVHEHGATTPELASYLGMTTKNMYDHLQKLQDTGKVTFTLADRNTKLWSLTSAAATERSAVLTPAPTLPFRTTPIRARRTR